MAFSAVIKPIPIRFEYAACSVCECATLLPVQTVRSVQVRLCTWCTKYPALIDCEKIDDIRDITTLYHLSELCRYIQQYQMDNTSQTAHDDIIPEPLYNYIKAAHQKAVLVEQCRQTLSKCLNGKRKLSTVTPVPINYMDGSATRAFVCPGAPCKKKTRCVM